MSDDEIVVTIEPSEKKEGNEVEKTNDEQSISSAFDWKSLPHIWFIIQGLSSITLTLFNKKLAKGFPHPFIVLLIQNTVSVLLILLMQFTKSGAFEMKKVQLKHFTWLILPTIGYCIVLWTSLEGLALVSVPLIVVTRNLVPLAMGIIESTFFGLKLNLDGYISLIMIFLGSVMYTISDFSVTTKGLFWVSLNLSMIIAVPLAEKKIMEAVKREQTPTGISFIRNVISIPMFLAVAVLKGNFSENLFSLSLIPLSLQLMLAGTCIAGLTIGLSYYYLLKLVSNTAITIAATTYKIITLLLGILFFNDSFGVQGWFGIIICFYGISWYSLMNSKSNDSNNSQSNETSQNDGLFDQIKRNKVRTIALTLIFISLLGYATLLYSNK